MSFARDPERKDNTRKCSFFSDDAIRVTEERPLQKENLLFLKIKLETVDRISKKTFPAKYQNGISERFLMAPMFFAIFTGISISDAVSSAVQGSVSEQLTIKPEFDFISLLGLCLSLYINFGDYSSFVKKTEKKIKNSIANFTTDLFLAKTDKAWLKKTSKFFNLEEKIQAGNSLTQIDTLQKVIGAKIKTMLPVLMTSKLHDETKEETLENYLKNLTLTNSPDHIIPIIKHTQWIHGLVLLSMIPRLANLALIFMFSYILFPKNLNKFIERNLSISYFLSDSCLTQINVVSNEGTRVVSGDSLFSAKNKILSIKQEILDRSGTLNDQIARKFLSFWKMQNNLFYSEPTKLILEYIGGEKTLDDYQVEAAQPMSLRK